MEKKARHYLAKYHALSNAAEFIRGHGEEGFSFEDEAFQKEYKKAISALSDQLDNRADSFLEKYNRTGITIDDSIDDGDASFII